MSLHRLVYVSRALRPAELSLEAVAQIVAVSSRNNARLDLTGMLLAHDGWFVQALEGSRATVSSLLFKIAEDPRHKALEILAFEPILRRDFPSWSMGHARVTPELLPVLAQFSDLAGRLDAAKLPAAQALSLLDTAARSAAQLA